MKQLTKAEEVINSALKYYKLAQNEDPDEPRFYYQICALIDQTSNDPKVKLEYFENFIKKHGTLQRFFLSL